MDGSPQRVCSSDESLRFFFNFFMRFAIALKSLIIEKLQRQRLRIEGERANGRTVHSLVRCSSQDPTSSRQGRVGVAKEN